MPKRDTKSTAKAWRDRNPDKSRGSCRAWYAKNSEYRKAYAKTRSSQKTVMRAKFDHRLSQYGLTRAEYDDLIVACQGRCTVCGVADTPAASKLSLCVDHDHATGAVRGLLCRSCNLVIGLAGDDPSLLIALSDYLKLHE